MANNPYENYSYDDLMKLRRKTEEEEMYGDITHEEALDRYSLIDLARVKNGNEKQVENVLKTAKEGKETHEKFAEESSLKSTTYRVGGYPQSMVDEEKANADRSNKTASQYDAVIKAAEQKKNEKKPLTSSYMSFSYSDLSNNRKRIEEQQMSGDITSEAAQREYDDIDIARAYNGNASELKDFIKQAKASKKNWEEISKENVVPLAPSRMTLEQGKAYMKEVNTKASTKRKADERVRFYDDLIAIANSSIDKIEKDEAATSANEYYGNIAQERGGSSDYVPSEWVHSDYDNINRFADAGTRGGVWGMLSSEELSTLNSLYNMDRDNPVLFQKYFDELKPVLEYRLANKESEEAREFGEAHPYIAGVESVARNVIGAVPAAVDNVVEGVFGNGVNTYDATSRYLRESQSYRSGGSQYMNDKYGEGATWAYNTGLSLVENVANVALFKGAGSAASALISVNMASNAAAQQMINIADRGGDNTQILVGGVTAGLTEYFFEKVSLDRLFEPKVARNLIGKLKNGLKQGGVEMSEELFTEVSNVFLDSVIMQNNSENAIKRRKYVIEDGLTAEEAAKKVFMETLDQVLQVAASAFVSGGIMGTGASYMQSASRNNYMTEVGERVMQNPTVMNRLIEFGVKSDNKEANAIAETLKEGYDVTPKEVGKMIDSVIGQSITNDGGMMNIANNIVALEGNRPSFRNSQELLDTAKAVVHLAQGKTTEADNALISRSSGAMTLLSAIETDSKAMRSIRESAKVDLRESAEGVRNAEYGVRNDSVAKINESLSETKVLSHGKQVVVPEGAKIKDGIVVSKESEGFRKSNVRAFNAIKKFAKTTNTPVIFVDELTGTNDKGEVVDLDGLEFKDGIIVNVNSKDPVMFAASHEFGHRLKRLAPDTWAKYQEYVILHEKKNGRYESAYNEKKQNYDADKIDEEIAADVIRKMFSDEKELTAFIRKDRGLAVKIRDAWYGVLDRLGLLDEKKKAQQLWGKAYREAVLNKDKKNEGDVKFSKSDLNKSSNSGKIKIDEKWVPDLSKKRLAELKKIIARDVHTSNRNITDTANWILTRIDGQSVFAIYSTENINDPVLLYESKDGKALFERDVLLNVLEEYENGKGINGKSSAINEVLGGSWMRAGRSATDDSGTLGRESSNRNAEVLQRKSSRKPSRAFTNVLENLIKIQRSGVRKSVSGTRLSEIDTEYLELAKNPEKNEARLREMVEEAAKRAGYDSPILYHGTQSFGFTEFDLSKSDDKRTIFLTSNERIASTYSGVSGKRRISDAYKKNFDNLSTPEIADELNYFTKEYFKDTYNSEFHNYSYYDLKKLNTLINRVNDGLINLKEDVDSKIKEYADKMAVDWDEKTAKTHKNLVELKEKIDAWDYHNLSTPIYMLIHHTDVFVDKSAEYADLEADIRLMNKLRNSKSIENGNVVWESMNRYSINVISRTAAIGKLKELSQQGNYAMYAKMGESLVVDGRAQNWNDIKRWTDAVVKDAKNFEIVDDDLNYYLKDKSTGEIIEEANVDILKTKNMSSADVKNFLLNKYKNILDVKYESVRTTRGIAEFAKENGYDSVLIKNITDNGGQNYNVDMNETADIYIVFDSNNVKSADLVTYDDDGNVIPLSERFNTKNDDIRYSIAGTRLSEYEDGELERLTKENAELRAQLENMSKFSLSKVMQNTAEIRKAAEDLKRGYGSKMSVSDIQSELTELYNYMVGKDTKSDEGVRNRIHSLAQKVINQATETVTNEQYGELLDRIKEVKIRVPESERADFADGYEYFRKHNMGKITLANNGLDLDVFWYELTSEYGELFKENFTGSQERLERIIEIRDEISPTEESIYKTREEYERAVLSLENDIYDSFYNIPKSEGGNKFIFYGKRAPMKTTAEETSKERARAKKIGWNKSELKKKIDSDYNYISKMLREPTDQRHIPEDMRGSVAFLLEQFNFETAQIDRLRAEGKEADSPTAVRLSKMYDAYADIMRKAWGIDKGAEKSELMDNYLSEDLQALRDEIPLDESGEHKRIQDMSVEELRSIAKVLASIHHVITTRNKAFNSAVKEEISELGQSSVQDLENIRRMRRGSGERLDYNGAVKLFDSYFNIDTVQPWDFFHQMGDTLERLYMEERKAFNSHVENIREAQGVLTEATKNVDLKKLTDKNAEEVWIDLQSGEKIKLTKGQILSLYALYQRNQGKEHILGGGIVTNNESKNSEGQKTSANKAHAVTQADMGKMFEEISTEEKEMVRKVVNFLSKRCAEWGNETSMRLYGYEKYGEGWYFPIKVSKQALNTYYGEKGEGTLRSQGFTKSTVKKAQNAIEVSDFFDTVTSHINGMSLYNTIALPMLDLERVLNYSQSSVSDKVRQEIVKTFGKSSEKYIEVFHKDINGSRKAVDNDKFTEMLMANAKKASIGLNARVFLQQPTSIARVFLFMNPKDMPVKWNVADTKREMQENIPIAYWKSLGFRDVGTGSSIKQVLLDNETLYDKAAMGLYGAADDFTWSLIYATVKNEVARQNPSLNKDSDAFMDKVRERFDYIVDRSQVVDSIFHRTQSMRSKNAYTKNATMFMSEPLKTYNMYRTELLDAYKNGTMKTTLPRATAVFVVSNILLAIAQALPDTWREDDEKELFKDGKDVPLWKIYLKKLKENMIDNSNPLTYMPYVKDIWSLIQGYSAERVEYSGISDLLAAAKRLTDEKRTIRYRALNLVKPAAAVLGISAGNLMRDMFGIGKTVYRLVGDEYADYLMTKWNWDVKNDDNKSKFMKHYERAVQNGHVDDAATILTDYLSETFKGEDFENEHAKTVIAEMSKLYGKTDGNSKLIYSLPSQKFDFDGKEIKIPDKEYPEYVSGSYDKLFDLAYEFVTSDEYKTLTDEEKVKSFGEIKTYSQKSQRMETVEGYELEGWEKNVYEGKTTFADSVVERFENKKYQNERDKYKDEFTYDASKYSEKEIGVIEGVESDAATYYTSIEMGREYNEDDLRHIKVYDEKLKDEMPIEEYAGVRAYAKKTAAMEDGKASMKKDELYEYLESTDYSPAVKSALFEAIGNKGWKNPYTGEKIQ